MNKKRRAFRAAAHENGYFSATYGANVTKSMYATAQKCRGWLA